MGDLILNRLLRPVERHPRMTFLHTGKKGQFSTFMDRSGGNPRKYSIILLSSLQVYDIHANTETHLTLVLFRDALILSILPGNQIS